MPTKVQSDETCSKKLRACKPKLNSNPIQSACRCARKSQQVSNDFRFYSKGDQIGRGQLSKGKIVEPTKQQVYDLARCLGTNKLLMLRGDGSVVSGLHLQKFNPSDWAPVGKSMKNRPRQLQRRFSWPCRLRMARNKSISYVLNRSADSNQLEQLQICITLSVSHENGSPVFAVHRKGSSSQRLSWIEAYLAENQEAEALLLKRFEEEMKIKTKVQSSAKPHQIEPLVSAMAHVKRNISSSSKTMLLLNQHEALLTEISSKG